MSQDSFIEESRCDCSHILRSPVYESGNFVLVILCVHTVSYVGEIIVVLGVFIGISKNFGIEIRQFFVGVSSCEVLA